MLGRKKICIAKHKNELWGLEVKIGQIMASLGRLPEFQLDSEVTTRQTTALGCLH